MSLSAPGVVARGQVSYSAPADLALASITTWLPSSNDRSKKETIPRTPSDSAFFITRDLQKGSVTGVLVRGGFGWIRRGRLRSGLSVAIKVLQPRDLKVKSVEKSKRFRNEVMIWSRLEHKNILPFLGLVDLNAENIAETGLVSPWEKNGNVNDFYQKYPEVNRLPMILGILSGLHYLHTQSIVHGDLRGANILVSKRGEPMLCDFGLALIVEDLTMMSISTVLQGSGNCRWMAIELLFHDALPTKESDMWSFGMVILELFSNKPPFCEKSNEAQVVLALNINERPPKPSAATTEIGFCESLWTVMENSWNNIPELRPSADELLPLLTPVLAD